MDYQELAKVVQEYQDGLLKLAKAKQLLKKQGAPDFLIREVLQCK